MKLQEHEKTKIKSVINKLANAMQELNDILLEEYNDEVSDVLNDNYPFEQSFDELTIDVKKWKSSVENKINNSK